MKYVGKFFAIIFSIIYMAFLIVFISLNYSRNLLSGNFYSNVLKSVDLDEIKISDVANTFDGMEHYENASLQDVIVEGLTDGGMDEDEATAIVENETIKEVVGNLIGEIVEYSVNGGEVPEISKDEIEKIISDPSLNTESKDFTDEEINEIYNNLNSMVNQILEGDDIDAE